MITGQDSRVRRRQVMPTTHLSTQSASVTMPWIYRGRATKYPLHLSPLQGHSGERPPGRQMDEGTHRVIPRARERGLIVRELEEETIVYDLETDRAHCLNPISAIIWKQCDGRTTVAEMVDILRETEVCSIAEDTVWRALVQLAEYELLEERVSRPTHGSISRREWMKRTGLTAAVALPLITSLAVPSAAMAASNCSNSTGRSDGCPCTSGSQCADGCCANGICQSPSSTGKVPTGGTCKGNGNCCSAHCVVTAGHTTGICT